MSATRKLVYDINNKPNFRNLIIYSPLMLLIILSIIISLPIIIHLSTQIYSSILIVGIFGLILIILHENKLKMRHVNALSQLIKLIKDDYNSIDKMMINNVSGQAIR